MAWPAVFLLLAAVRPVGSAPTDAQKPTLTKPGQFKATVPLQKPSGGARFGAGAFGGTSSASSASTADIAVNILDQRFYPVKTYVLRGLQAQDRVENLWDGKDAYGREMPPGRYFASLSIVYSDGTKASQFYGFVKE